MAAVATNPMLTATKDTIAMLKSITAGSQYSGKPHNQNH